MCYLSVSGRCSSACSLTLILFFFSTLVLVIRNTVNQNKNLPVNFSKHSPRTHSALKRLRLHVTTVYTSHPLQWLMRTSEKVFHSVFPQFWPEEIVTLISDLMFTVAWWQVKDGCRPFPPFHLSDLLAVRPLSVLNSSQSRVSDHILQTTPQATLKGKIQHFICGCPVSVDSKWQIKPYIPQRVLYWPRIE